MPRQSQPPGQCKYRWVHRVVESGLALHSSPPSSSAWRASELFERPGWSYELSDDEITALQSFAEGEPRPPELERLAAKLPAELEEGAGAVRIRRLPVGSWDQPTIEKAFWDLSHQLGTPISQSAAGEKLFHVRDAGYAPNDPRFRGPMSSKKLSFHTDRCDVIAFLGIRPAAQGGKTFVVNSQALHEELAR